MGGSFTFGGNTVAHPYAVGKGGRYDIWHIVLNLLAASMRRWKAHLFYDGAVAEVRMQKIEARAALQKTPNEATVPNNSPQITDSLFFTSEIRVRIREICR